MKGLETLAGKEYPGRLISLGLDLSERYLMLGYGVTVRTPSFRERVFVDNVKSGTIRVDPVDPKQLEDPMAPLLFYNAVRGIRSNVVVSNGNQTDVVYGALRGIEDPQPEDFLKELFARPHPQKHPDPAKPDINLSSYEPDPISTPRITMLVNTLGASLAIFRRGSDGSPEQEYFTPKLEPGKGVILSTYEGTNVAKPAIIAPFTGAPFHVSMPWQSPKEGTAALLDALGPKTGPGIVQPDEDFRVGVAVLFYDCNIGRVVGYDTQSLREKLPDTTYSP